MQRLVFLRWDEAAPRLPAEERGKEGRRGVSTRIRCCIVLMLEDEVVPHSPVGRRGAALFFCWMARWRLVFQRWDEALPRFTWAETRRCLGTS
ncbi:hypothetical protein BHE74_00058424 [Ensete ventricosum]|nr:hypothetical protein BHE74_00058424 [Ensete ventricosum]RZS14942.1 hypothetical protein BHM03_00046708 [Ensete ventricosum]